MGTQINLAILFLGILYFESISSETECEVSKDSPGVLKIRILGRRNETGKWVTKFSAYKDDSEIDKPNDIALDITQGVEECNGKRALVVRGHIFEENKWITEKTDKPLTDKNGTGGIYGTDKIRFHPKCGGNAGIIDNGRTVRKIVMNECCYASAFTNRPLKDNELFEVMLVSKSRIFGHSLAIGVSPYSPNDIMMQRFISELQPPCWSMYYGHVYHNRGAIKPNYGRSLDTIEVGDRVGMVRRDTGDLHFFVNGVDLGVAATGTPKSVYGIIELYENAAMATIVGS